MKDSHGKIDAFAKRFTKEDYLFLVGLRACLFVHADKDFGEAVRATFKSIKKRVKENPECFLNSPIAMSLWICWSQLGNK